MYDMKSVSLITILDNVNFGTYLQALALCKVVETFGYDVSLVHYTRPFMTRKNYPLVIRKEYGFFRWLTHCVLSGGMNSNFNLKDKNIKFLKKHISLTREFVSFEDLRKDPPISTIYMTGSDQVWNSIHNKGIDRSFFLDFVPKGGVKIAYAASFGVSEIPSKEKKEIVPMLRNYKKITVREDSASEILANFGIEADVVLDPTLLLNKREWANLVDVSLDFSEPYLLTYSVENAEQDKLIEYYARKISKEKKLKIYHVSYLPQRKTPAYADRSFHLATMEVFVKLVYNSSFVIVSSFHGTAFAINFNKNFLSVAPSRFDSRVKSLLKIVGLEDRLVSEKCRIVNVLDIDYGKVNEVLDCERSRSLCVLREMLRKECL